LFEFDPIKSESNLKKHGIDFESGTKLWEDPRRLEIPAKTKEEARFLLIAEHQNEIWSAVYTLRKDRIRIISIRKARKNEKEIYFQ
jgi:uncharacterized protein